MTLLPDQKGFTMIELIVVIVVLGLLVLGGIFGVKQIMDGYSLAQANATSTQKAQNALGRIAIELSHITYNSSGGRYNLSAGTVNSVTYIANFGGADETHTINQNADLVRFDNNDNMPLTDRVVTNGLQFSYWDGNGNSVGATAADMRLIEIALMIQVTPTVTRTYNARVALQQ
jgi:prepilin-type N-terminal cleavage/methylation domain-containing protein